MDLKFPRMVYTSPGPHQCEGGSFGYELAKDQADYDAALKAGFSPSVPEALKDLEARRDAEALARAKELEAKAPKAQPAPKAPQGQGG